MLVSQPADITDSNKIKVTNSSYYFTEKMPKDEQESVSQYGGYYGQNSSADPSQIGYDTVHPCNIYDMGENV